MRPRRGATDISAAGQWLDGEYALDLAAARGEFRAVDTSSPASLRGWFLSHRFLAANDHSAAAGVCPRTVRRWKAAAGLPGAGSRQPPGWRRPGRPLEAPPDWRDGGWLRDQYAAGHGIRAIARAVGRSYTFTRRLLRRRGVALRGAGEAARPGHPCCGRHWLVLHYAVRGLSLTACARLAGVSKSTMTDWLLRFRIRIRGVGEQLLVDRNRAGAEELSRPNDHPSGRRGQPSDPAGGTPRVQHPGPPPVVGD